MKDQLIRLSSHSLLVCAVSPLFHIPVFSMAKWSASREAAVSDLFLGSEAPGGRDTAGLASLSPST